MQIIYNKPVIHKSEEVKRLTEVRVHENESIDRALKRFKRQCARTGVLSEYKRKEFYEKPSVVKKRKIDQAKRKKRRG